MKRILSYIAASVVAVSLQAQPAINSTAKSTASRSGSAPLPVKEPSRLAQAARAAQAPVLDGKLEDIAWKTAPVIDEFLEYEPTTGAVPRFKTEVRILYDDKYLYVMARMSDPAPDSIISLLSRRDVRTESEQLKLVIDSYHDKRTAYQFITNPAGVKRDFYVQ
ncbi:MAG: carbohydrate binding family 9 domain-containing protein [Gemmatimonadaceae bacterium]